MQLYWLDQTEADVPLSDDWLSSLETVFVQGLRIPKRRTDWKLGRWTAKRSVAIWKGMPIRPELLKKIEIRPAPSGAPEVFIADVPAELSMSLSHRAGRAVCVVARHNVDLGCDLEMIEPHTDAFLSDFFTREEQALVAHASAENRMRVIALLWSAKESALKALKTGLRLDTRDVSVTLGGSFDLHGWSPLRVRCNSGRAFQGWWQQMGCMMGTVVADPAAGAPIRFLVTARAPDLVAQYA